MTQRQQVIDAMEKLGGLATLGELNKSVDCADWNTKTPFASIRRILQMESCFFKVKPGLWGLTVHKEQVRRLTDFYASSDKQQESDHSYYQGLLLEIGNTQKYKTYAPDQDKNRLFLREITLGQLRNLEQIHPFTYPNIVKRARMIDVIWFNHRKMPYAAFEVEHSTDFSGALTKYMEMQDFNTKFYVVADRVKRRQFEDRISRDQYRPLHKRVQFIDYQKLVDWHTNSMQIKNLGDLP